MKYIKLLVVCVIAMNTGAALAGSCSGVCHVTNNKNQVVSTRGGIYATSKVDALEQLLTICIEVRSKYKVPPGEMFIGGHDSDLWLKGVQCQGF